MIDVASVYLDSLDTTNKTEGGSFTIPEFNRFSKRAELRIRDYLTGDISGQQLPLNYASQKNSDWLSPFITPYQKNVTDGEIVLPDDYYQFEELFRLGGFKVNTCEADGEDETVKISNTPIELLTSSKFTTRLTTYIKDLKPSFKKPIAKLQGNKIIFEPADLGSVQLSYIRYPVYAVLGSQIDQERNDEIPVSVKDYEYGEWARELLVYFIVTDFSIHTREQALFQANQAKGKTVRQP